MTDLAAHPSSSSSDRDTAVLAHSFRLKVMDVATKKGLPLAPATRPEVVDEQVASADHKQQVSLAVLRRRATHPMRVMAESDARFYVADSVKRPDGSTATVYRGFSYPVKALKTCTLSAPDAGGKRTPDWLWSRVDERFLAHRGANEFKIGRLTFLRIRDPDQERYVLTRSTGKSGETIWARRDLITDENGVLDIPLTLKEWNEGVKITVAFRDHLILAARSPFEHDPETAEFDVRLTGDPTGNAWEADAFGVTESFVEELEFELPPRGAAGMTDPETGALVHDAVWAVRRAIECESDHRTRTTRNRPNNVAAPDGVVIHYNSGIYVNEYRGNNFLATRNALPAGTRNCLDARQAGENDFVFDAEMALGLLWAIFTNATAGRDTSVGYHYHIERSGAIMLVVPEENRTGHAGASREPDRVVASDPNGIRQTVHDNIIRIQREDLDQSYIGVNLLGTSTNRRNGAGRAEHFNERQHFYLDRLIENIMARRSTMPWFQILGHDEVRAAYKSQHTTSGQHDKNDPGDALHQGGMEGLRWRHGGNEGQTDATSHYLVFDGSRLTWFDASGKSLRHWAAVSGRPGHQSSDEQNIADKGPIPSGKYHVRQSEYQAEADRSYADEALGLIGRGAWPGGEASWGKHRIWLHPANDEAARFDRSGFSIHGGRSPGSAGCIDLTGHMDDFAKRFLDHGEDLMLLVRYG